MEVTKDNLDLVILVAATLFILAQIAFYILKKMHPPIVEIKPSSKLAKMVEDLHEWHDQKDTNGRLVWWGSTNDKEVAKAMTKSFQEISNTQRELVHTLRSMAQTQDSTTYLIKECLSEIKANRK